jgi:hypothetical protein
MHGRAWAMILAVGAAAATHPPPAGARGVPTTARPQQLAKMLAGHTVFSAVHPRRPTATRVPARTPITGGQTVLPVTGRFTTTDGTRWLRVELPGRPNARIRWLAARIRPGVPVTITG